jgi:ribose transport system ATP-binding protein
MESILRIDSLKKQFPGVLVLRGISFSLQKGKIYGLVGENGAGKSTLVKILMGLHQPDSGTITINDEEASVKSPTQARNEYKLDAVFQEHALIPHLSVAENLFLDRLDDFYRYGLLNTNRLYGQAREVLKKIDVELDVSLPADSLQEGEKSLVELARALDRNPNILILDEMTAPLTSQVVQDLFSIIRRLKEEGKTLIFISHRLEEVLKICDEIIVLKDGNLEGIVKKKNNGDLPSVRRKIISMMTGTEKGLDFPPKVGPLSEAQVVLSLENISSGRLNNVSIQVRKGEIVALAGLRGQGQSTLLRTVTGLLFRSQGTVSIFGRPVKIDSPREAMKNGIFFVSDRRDQEELWLAHDVWLNMSLASVDSRTKFGVVPRARDRKIVEDMVARLKIATPNIAKVVRQLSGGNRQKVVLGKYLLANPRVLLLDQPTLGLDVGAKIEIYYLLRELATAGIPTLTVLTDLEEVVNLPDRIFVMHEGQIVREFSGIRINQEELLDSYYG